MKQAKKLTRLLKEAVTAYGLVAEQWMLLRDGDPYVTIVHKENGRMKIIDKYARAKKGERG